MSTNIDTLITTALDNLGSRLVQWSCTRIPQSVEEFDQSVRHDLPDGVGFAEFENQVNILRPLLAVTVLRTERNAKLVKSDVYALPDYSHGDEQVREAWLDYRQALRDLPANSPDATIDPESGSLVGVVWPNEPST